MTGRVSFMVGAMKRLSPREGYDLYARNYRQDHPHLDSFMDGAENEAWVRNLEELLEAQSRLVALDVGCGDGRTLGRWRRRLESRELTDRVVLWGTDVSPKMLEAGRGRVKGVEWGLLDIAQPAAVEAWRRAHGPADLVSAFFVLVHVARPEAFFAGAAGLLAPGGRLVANTIPQPSAPELRASGKPIVIEAFDHGADEVAAAALAAGFRQRSRRDYEDRGEVISTLFEWDLSAPGLG